MEDLNVDKLQVKNDIIAAKQLTAEQLLMEAASMNRMDDNQSAMAEFKLLLPNNSILEISRKRRRYEENLRKFNKNERLWIRYANFEVINNNFERARSIFERALQTNYEWLDVWNKYIDFEIKYEFINSAHNLLERAVTTFPRINKFWFKYVLLEQALRDYDNCRIVFNKWLYWKPEISAYIAYAKFEEKYSSVESARQVYDRLLNDHPSLESFMHVADWEISKAEYKRARVLYERCSLEIPLDKLDEKFFDIYASFEDSQKNYDRVEKIYEKGLDFLGNESAQLLDSYVKFQRRNVKFDKAAIAVYNNFVYHCEKQLLQNSKKYDLWYDLTFETYKQIIISGNPTTIDKLKSYYGEIFKSHPDVNIESGWQLYFYLILNALSFYETVCDDLESCESIFEHFVVIVPHKTFTFPKIWVFWSEFCLRHKNVKAARLNYGRSIGLCPNIKIFQAYKNMEMKLGNIDRCRMVCAAFIKKFPTYIESWFSLIELEISLSSVKVVRQIFEVALSLNIIIQKDLLWITYIIIEHNFGKIANVRDLFNRYFESEKKISILKALAQYDLEINANYDESIEIIKNVIEICKRNALNEERANTINFWFDIEKRRDASKQTLDVIKQMMPKKIIKQRKVQSKNGNVIHTEEFVDYIFKDTEDSESTQKILEAVKKWKESNSSKNSNFVNK